MPPTFADYVALPHMEAIYVLRISGLPYLFSNANLPARWGGPTVHIYDGEDYTWLPILSPSDGFAAVGTRIEPKGGVGQSGGCEFELVATGYQSEGLQDDTLLSILLASVGRADGKLAASLAADIPADLDGAGSTLDMIVNPWFGATAPRVLYVGTETLDMSTYTSNAATSLTATLTRGRFGSWAQTHTGTVRDGAVVQGGAMYLADYPLTLVGRIAELWCCPGEFRRDSTGRPTFYPHGQSLADAANQIIYAGVVDGHGEDGAVVSIRTSSLDQLLRGSVLRDVPTALLRTDTGYRTTCYIGPHNWWLHLDLELDGTVNWPILYIPDNSALTAGDSITIGSTTLIAGTHWAIAANSFLTLSNIIAAMLASAGYTGGFFVPYFVSTGIEVQAGRATAGNPSGTAFTVTTTNPDALMIAPDTGTLAAGSGRQFLGQRLRRSQNGDGAAPFEDVPEALYTYGTLSSYITDTLAELQPASLQLQAALYYAPTATAEAGRVVMTLAIAPARVGNAARVVWLTVRGDKESFLRDLGWSGLEFEMVREDTNPDGLWEAVADRGPAALRIPASPRPIPRRIYIQNLNQWGAQWLLAAGWEDDEANVQDVFVSIKDAGLVQVGGLVQGDLYEGSYLSVCERAPTVLGSQNTEEIYVEYSDTEPPVVEVSRVVALPFTSANRMMLYMLLGGTGYGVNDATWDQGWPGSGLGIPARLVEIGDWTDLDAERPERRDGWVWTAKDDSRKLLDEELKATQQQIVSDLGKLRLVAMDVPLEAIPRTRRTVGPEQTVTEDKGVGFDRQPNRIVNVVRVKGGWDARDGKYLLEQDNRQQDSIGTWGEQQAIEVELRGLSAVGDAAAKGRAIAQRIFGLYARPYALVEVDVAMKEAWLWGIGDEVLLSHPWVPNPTLPRRGCTDMLCRIVNKEARFAGGNSKSFVTLTLMSYALAGQRYSAWGPSAQLIYSGTANTWTVVEDVYGPDRVRGFADSDYFQLGYGIKTMRLGDSSASPVTRTIATRTGSIGSVKLTFSAALSGSASQRYVMWYADHDSATLADEQLMFTFMSGFGGTLALPSGTAPAFFYR